MKNKRNLVFVVLALLLLVSVATAVAIGPVRISVIHILAIFYHKIFLWSNPPVAGPTDEIIWHIRLPRVLLAVLVGLSLAMAGTTFQCLFRNPMADPYIIGVSAGAGLGATLAIVLHLRLLHFSAVPPMAFVTAMLTTFAVYGLAKRGRSVSVVTLLLAGIAVSSFLSAVISFLMVLGKEGLQQAFLWLLGGLSERGWGHVEMILPYALVGSLVLFIFARDLNILLLGEESAEHLGIDVERLKKIMVAAATLMTAAAVSVSGLIGFVGLIVPHMMRIVVGPDHRRLLPAAALGGAIIMVWADTFARSALQAGEIPLGVVTALLGAPFFIYLLRTTVGKAF